MPRRYLVVLALVACGNKNDPPPTTAAPTTAAPTTVAPTSAAPKDPGTAIELVGATVVPVGAEFKLDARWRSSVEKLRAMRADARCVVAGHVFAGPRRMMVPSAEPHGSLFEDGLPAAPERCEVMAYAGPAARTPTGAACWTPGGITPGPCANMPSPSPPPGPLAIEELAIKPSSTGTVGFVYTIVQGSAARASLVRHKLSCLVGKTVYGDLPDSFAMISSPGIAPGDRMRIARTGFEATEMPGPPSACELTFWYEPHEYAREDRSEVLRACWTDKATTLAPCTGWPTLVPAKSPIAISRVAIRTATATTVLDKPAPTRLRVTGEATVGVAVTDIMDGLSAQTRYKAGAVWKTVDQRGFDRLRDLVPGEVHLFAIDLPETVTTPPALLELTVTWMHGGGGTELATYCFAAGKPRRGRCPS